MKAKEIELSKSIEAGIGLTVMEFRKLVNLKQAELAEKLDTTQASISQIESGKCLPGGHFILKLLDVFPMVNLYWLFLGVEKPFREKKATKANREPIKILNNMLSNCKP